jgi:putative hydrolase of the HAD superfamily
VSGGPVRALLVDLDDTLYAYAPCNEVGLEAVFERLQRRVVVSRDGFRALHDEVRLELARELAGQAASHDRMLFLKRIVERLLGRVEVGLVLELHELYWEAFLARAEPAPDAHAVLGRLSRRMPVVLVTNQVTAVQLAKVRRLGFEESLHALVTSQEAGADKPDPRIFRLALAAAGVGAEEALMVGDTIRGDLEGATAAGIRCVHTREFRDEVAPPGLALASLGRLGELPAVLEGLSGPLD